MFQLAEHLHKSVNEIEQLSSRELSEWMAYFNVKNKAQEKQRIKQKAESKQQSIKRNKGI